MEEHLQPAVLEQQVVRLGGDADVAGVPGRGGRARDVVQHPGVLVVVELAREVELLFEILDVPLGPLNA